MPGRASPESTTRMGGVHSSPILSTRKTAVAIMIASMNATAIISTDPTLSMIIVRSLVLSVELALNAIIVRSTNVAIGIMK